MIRFILKREYKLYDFRQETFETLDIDLPELEIKFLRGGSSEQGHDITTLVGIEFIAEQEQVSDKGYRCQNANCYSIFSKDQVDYSVCGTPICPKCHYKLKQVSDE